METSAMRRDNFLKGLIYFLLMLFLLSNSVISYAAAHNLNSQGNTLNDYLDRRTRSISLDFQFINTRDLLQILADLAQKNIIVSEQVTGRMSIKLHHITWQEAFDVVLKMRGLSKQEENSVIFIAPSADIEKYVKQQIQAQAQTQAQQVQTATPTTFAFKHAVAEDISNIIAKQNNLVANSNISVDKQNNTILVNASMPQLNAIQKVTKNLDIPAKQVLIEGQIVIADDKVIDELGLTFSSVATKRDSGTAKVSNMTMDLPLDAITSSPGHVGFAIAKLGRGVLLNMELAALEQVGHARIISSPKLITINNQTAYIESGQELPYQEKTISGATNIAFKKAVLSLKATPMVISVDKVILNLSLNQDKVSDITVNGVPAIQTQQMQTQVALTNGETVVLGGIYEYATIENNTNVPVLSAIPIIGNLFRSKHREVTRKELLIFVTPRIL